MNFRLMLVMMIFLVGKGFGQFLDWSTVGEMPLPVYGGEAVAYDSVIYIFGGYSDSLGSATDWIQAYYPHNDKWKMIGKMNEKRSDFVALRYQDEIIIYGGLTEEDTASAVLQRIKIKSDSIVITSDTTLKENRLYPSGVIMDSLLIIIGGSIDYNKQIQVDSTYIFAYNLNGKYPPYKINSLFSTTDNNIPIQQMCAVYNDNIYIFGGIYLGISPWIYQFNLGRNEYAKKGVDLIESSAGGRAVAGGWGNIYIIGGYNESTISSNTAIKSVEVYNVWSNHIRYDTPLKYPRKEFMAINYNNRLYVFGGKGSGDKIEPNIEMTYLFSTNTAEDSKSSLAAKFALNNCYPNPFNPETKISFSIPHNSNVTLTVFSVLGEKVRTLVSGYRNSGKYDVTWDGRDDNGNNAASGVYFYNLSDGVNSFTRKAILLK